MKDFFYYFRDKENKPRVTVCLKVDTERGIGAVARGVAICSLSDNPNKKKGRQIASGRAARAAFRGNRSYRIARVEAIAALESTAEFSTFPVWSKSEFFPELTEFEKKLLGLP